MQEDCQAESACSIQELQNQLGAGSKQVNRTLEDRVRTAFFELTLQEVLLENQQPELGVGE